MPIVKNSTEFFWTPDEDISPTVSGMWKINMSDDGNDLLIQRHDGEEWITKQTISE